MVACDPRTPTPYPERVVPKNRGACRHVLPVLPLLPEWRAFFLILSGISAIKSGQPKGCPYMVLCLCRDRVYPVRGIEGRVAVRKTGHPQGASLQEGLLKGVGVRGDPDYPYIYKKMPAALDSLRRKKGFYTHQQGHQAAGITSLIVFACTFSLVTLIFLTALPPPLAIISALVFFLPLLYGLAPFFIFLSISSRTIPFPPTGTAFQVFESLGPLPASEARKGPRSRWARATRRRGENRQLEPPGGVGVQQSAGETGQPD